MEYRQRDSRRVLLKSADFQKPAPNRKLILWLFLGTGILSGLVWWSGRRQDGLGWIKPLVLSYAVERKDSRSGRDASRTTARLVAEIKNSLTEQAGRYGIFVMRLNSGEWYGINEEEVMPAASIMKVPIMAAVHSAIDDGRIKLDEEYGIGDEDKRTGSGPLENYETGTRISVRKLLDEMGKKSDNTAPVILTKLVGREEIGKTITELGMKNTVFSDNTTTAADVGEMWRKIYKAEVVNAESRDLIWSYLTDSIYEDRIPAGLPDGLEVVHKVGTDLDVWADSGIIMGKSENKIEPIILVILNKEVNLEQAKNTVPEITRKIWEYESEKK